MVSFSSDASTVGPAAIRPNSGNRSERLVLLRGGAHLSIGCVVSPAVRILLLSWYVFITVAN